ncbi:hypothetical protein J2W42_006282 [Rhizobium tibeticum]|nr:hypothetical protein [Rhizobium tibeticum]
MIRFPFAHRCPKNFLVIREAPEGFNPRTFAWNLPGVQLGLDKRKVELIALA